LKPPTGGFFIYFYLPADLPAPKVIAAGRTHGVSCLPGMGCYANGAGTHEIRLAFSYQSVDNITEGIRRLGAAMKSVRA
jgi:2-aminoadipate transaminase